MTIRHLPTKRGENVGPVPWNVYPRPQMVRDSWTCLNGSWRFGSDKAMREEILVPFCPESLLSGIRREPDGTKTLYYSRIFDFDAEDAGTDQNTQESRVLLHFGAVDQIADVYLNGTFLGVHEGGYLPFSFDITKALRSGANELYLEVKDTLDHRLPWGKQKKDRGGMWYTPVSGIWQTVWLETVPKEYIKRLSVSTKENTVTVAAEGVREGTLTLDETGESISLADGRAVFTVKAPQYWTPETPHLYYFTLRAGADCVHSYFALRELSVRTINGKKRLCLNGAPYFFNGLLDQGYFSDGIYTPAAPKCYEDDILAMKSLGFNTLRKHIKIEPEQFYYECDRLGMVVFQDMVNNGEYRFLRDTALPTVLPGIRLNDAGLNRDERTRESFLQAMRETVLHLYSHPCICYWTVFNEGWGQFAADKAYRELKALDESRFIDATSGWFRRKESDVESLHVYFRRLRLGRTDKPQVLSEFGGYVWKVPGRSANEEKTYGYKVFGSREAFVQALRRLYLEQLLPLVRQGLCAGIYTQLSDVEDETNGLLTYDRSVMKIKPEEIGDITGLLQEAVKE